MHKEDSFSTLPAGLLSHKLQWGKNYPCEASLMTKIKDSWFIIRAHKDNTCFITASSATVTCPKLAGKLLPTNNPYTTD